MARGKYGDKAAARKAREERDAAIETYEQRVAKLVDENKQLRARLTSEREAASKERRTLKAMLREGSSPALVTAERENTRLREERDHARARSRKLQEQWSHAGERLMRYLKDRDGALAGDSFETALRILGEEADGTPVPDDVAVDFQNIGALVGRDAVAVERIQRARGMRA